MAGRTTPLHGTHFTSLQRAVRHLRHRPSRHPHRHPEHPLKAHRLWTSKGSQGGIELQGPTTTDILQLDQGSVRGPGLVSVTQNLLWTHGDIDPGGEITVLGNAELRGFGRIINTYSGGSSPIDNSSLFRLNVPGKALQLVDIAYRQTTRGTLEITLGDAGPAQLLGDPNRTLSLAGQLRVVLQNGFTPLLGQSFGLCQGRIGGTFAQTTLPDLGPALKFELVYSQTQVVLNVVPKP